MPETLTGVGRLPQSGTVTGGTLTAVIGVGLFGRGGPAIIVRRGMVGRFAALHQHLAADGVRVLWDRRVAERRRRTLPPPSQLERRTRDRRGPAPPSWLLLDFVVACLAPPGA